jgi:hypothetical protein
MGGPVGYLGGAIGALLACAALTLLGGCGSDSDRGVSAQASADIDPPQMVTVPNACASTVMSTIEKVGVRVYREGVFSSRTASALSLITSSQPLREAVEADDPAAARAAAQALIDTGHMTDLQVLSGTQMLAHVGAQHALAPLHGTILGASGAPIATFVASVWADSGLADELNGIAEGFTSLRQGGKTVAGSLPLPAGPLAPQGELTIGGVDYRYTSFLAQVYPAGELRVFVLKPIPAIAPLCGRSDDDTIVNTVSRMAALIYTGESGRQALVQVHRVQVNKALLSAVAEHDPLATEEAVKALLNEHIVRLRVSSGGQLLSDVGGPDVLAPVSAPLRLHGRQIGRFVLSIQDDLGYLLLAQRLVGLKVVMYRGDELVMSSLRPAPATLPASGSVSYEAQRYRVFTLDAHAFPSGPLRISALVPIPYR